MTRTTATFALLASLMASGAYAQQPGSALDQAMADYQGEASSSYADANAIEQQFSGLLSSALDSAWTEAQAQSPVPAPKAGVEEGSFAELVSQVGVTPAIVEISYSRQGVMTAAKLITKSSSDQYNKSVLKALAAVENFPQIAELSDADYKRWFAIRRIKLSPSDQ